jgi:hypothetical protein
MAEEGLETGEEKRAGDEMNFSEQEMGTETK